MGLFPQNTITAILNEIYIYCMCLIIDWLINTDPGTRHTKWFIFITHLGTVILKHLHKTKSLCTYLRTEWYLITLNPIELICLALPFGLKNWMLYFTFSTESEILELMRSNKLAKLYVLRKCFKKNQQLFYIILEYWLLFNID